jgi:hypothetical protein
MLESTYKTKIRYECPKRGWVEEEVVVKRYKSIDPPEGTAFDPELLKIELETAEGDVS